MRVLYNLWRASYSDVNEGILSIYDHSNKKTTPRQLSYFGVTIELKKMAMKRRNGRINDWKWTHDRVRFDRCHLLFEEYMQWKIHQFTILNYASKQANVLKNVYVEEKKLMTWNYLNLSFVWYKELCRSQRLLLRLYSTDLHNPSYYTQSINNNWIFINNQNRVLKMLGVASNAFNFCVCRACFRPVVLFHTYDQKGYVIY